MGTSTTITTATCTAGIRQALLKMNLAVPLYAADLVDAESNHYDYELEELTALQVVDVLLQGDDAENEFNRSLAFDAYFEDDRPHFRLRTPQADGDTLIVRYTMPHSINGLDSATDSTLPAFYDVVLLDGAAWQICEVLAAGHIETINMAPEVSKNFQVLADQFKQSFQAGINNLKHRPFTVSEPIKTGWSDQWNGQY